MMVVQWLNYVLSLLKRLVQSFLSLLPDSPFQSLTLGPIQDYLAYINYFFPVGQLMQFLALYVSAVIVWYGVRWVLRLSKFIQ